MYIYIYIHTYLYIGPHATRSAMTANATKDKPFTYYTITYQLIL